MPNAGPARGRPPPGFPAVPKEALSVLPAVLEQLQRLEQSQQEAPVAQERQTADQVSACGAKWLFPGARDIVDTMTSIARLIIFAGCLFLSFGRCFTYCCINAPSA